LVRPRRLTWRMRNCIRGAHRTGGLRSGLLIAGLIPPPGRRERCCGAGFKAISSWWSRRRCWQNWSTCCCGRCFGRTRPSRRSVRTWLCYAGLKRSCLTHPWSLASRLIRAMISRRFGASERRTNARFRRPAPVRPRGSGTASAAASRFPRSSPVVTNAASCRRMVYKRALDSHEVRHAQRCAGRRAGCPAGPFAVAREGSRLRQRKRSSIEARRLPARHTAVPHPASAAAAQC